MDQLKLDLGCGTRKRDGFVGVDARAFAGVDQVIDLGDTSKPWPWDDASVDEVNASHVVEHFTAEQRIHFVNELYRVLKPGAKALLTVPHWCSQRAYGDLSHQWPPVSEFWFFYLNKEWRAVNAPHNDFYRCDFEATWGYCMRPDVGIRNQEFQQFAMANYKEACLDTIATLTKR
jgi:SAM-dependent methyltransferase